MGSVSSSLASKIKERLTIDQDSVDTFLLQRLECLRTRVIEFSSLSDRKSSRPEDENLLRIDTRVLRCVLSSGSSGEFDRSGELTTSSLRFETLLDGRNEDVEEEFGIARTRCGLGMELNREERSFSRVDTFVRIVVGVNEEFFPTGSEGLRVDSVSVILRGDVASTTNEGGTRDVGTTVSVLELEG